MAAPRNKEACTDFQLFPSLPTEIRLKVWTIALSVPRVVEIIPNPPEVYWHPANFGLAGPVPAKSWTSSCPPPSLLHVNREARSEALDTYKPYFTTPPPPLSSVHCIYLNLSQDTIKLVNYYAAYLGEAERGEIQRMVLDAETYFSKLTDMKTLKQMMRLKEVEVLVPTARFYARRVLDDFRAERSVNPGWVCPRLTIRDKSTGGLVGVLDGGAMIPGWTMK